MTQAKLPPVAVIADAHFHDIDSDYGCRGIDVEGQRLTLRSWVDTRRSSRVFNESKMALQRALQDIEKRGIKHVVLLGDYTDDGQIEATQRLVDLLRRHRDQSGTQFFAITGNHDAFGPLGKHQSTRFVSDCNDTVLVTSDPEVAATEPESAIFTPAMYCEGVADGITKMSDFGLFNQSDYVHWESPFGLNDSVDTRQYLACSADGLSAHRLVDASYLVEPVAGLWLLMIDANVFEPRNGQWMPAQKKAFLDSSDAGWNSVLRNKPHLLSWIGDVCARARQGHKKLLAFSHYPIIDPFGDHEQRAFNLFGDHEMTKRQPEKAVAEKLLCTGLQLHFSGHLHVSALSHHSNNSQTIEDCAVPSLVAFPACYKIVHSASEVFDIDTVRLSSMLLDTRLVAYYQQEPTANSATDTATLSASRYEEFLYRRMQSRVEHHYLAKEWPAHLAQSVRETNVADLALFMASGSAATGGGLVPMKGAIASQACDSLNLALSPYDICVVDLTGCHMIQLISDWYCLRQASYLARTFITADNLRIYRYLTDCFAELQPVKPTTTVEFFAQFFGMMKLAIERSEPSATRERTLLS